VLIFEIGEIGKQGFVAKDGPAEVRLGFYFFLISSKGMKGGEIPIKVNTPF